MQITGVNNLLEPLLILMGILLAATIGAAIEYFKRLAALNKEYEKAKGTVDDIILSFNRQLKHGAEKLDIIAYKLEVATSKSEGALNKLDEIAKRVDNLEGRVLANSEGTEKVFIRLGDVENRVQGIVSSQEVTSTKIADFEGQVKRFLTTSETSFEPVIPIKREKALAQLTATEVSVLEMLTSEGPKTAPEIKEIVKLSREHTARLMKKLYEEGYLERDTTKMPFKYSVKKEMEKLLRKSEGQTI